MKIIFVNNKKLEKQFIDFRKKLYFNDQYYVSTIEFTFDMLFKKTTRFAKNAVIKPIMVLENNKVLAQALLIKASSDDFIQISFFEALDSCNEAVNLIRGEARRFAKEVNVQRIIIGLNGHLSYGVGLSVDMNKPNTFDSTYTKTYYPQYFDDCIKHNLYAFSSCLCDLLPTMKEYPTSITIRPIDFKKYKKEMELFRIIANQTLGKTFLYTETKEHHFEELISDMRFFLKPENILFAFDKDKIVGFIFWHPDYNEILKKGKNNSLLGIALRYTLLKKKIRTIKLNSIGVLEEYQGAVTMNLLYEASKYVKNYDFIETNFVWENNTKSIRINKHIMKNIERKFIVLEEKYES